MVSIHVLGHVCVDLTPELHSDHFAIPGELTEVGALNIRTGGTVSNCARTIKALNCEVYLSGRVGNDRLGAICRALLEDEHPGTVDLHIDPQAATSYSIVIHPPTTDRSFLHHTGANDFFDGNAPLIPHSIVHFGYPTLCPAMCADDGAPIVDLFTRAHEGGSATSLDLAYLAQNSPLRALNWSRLFTHVLPHTDVFCPSWDDLVSCLPGTPTEPGMEEIAAMAQRFIDAGASIVLITLGKDGSFLRTGSVEAFTPLEALCGIDAEAWAQASIHRKATNLASMTSSEATLSGTTPQADAAQVPSTLDTNGAGDTFKAAFLVALTRACGPHNALAFASNVVARKLLRLPLAPELGGYRHLLSGPAPGC